jgi:mono/diheme cytochrome c family protein
LTPIDRVGRGLIVSSIAFAAMFAGVTAVAQNLDAGKSPAKLFADGCATCHRGPRGLAKGRFSLTLAWFLKDHYATSAGSAKALAAYLDEVDASAARRTARSAANGSQSAPRPPKPVTGR